MKTSKSYLVKRFGKNNMELVERILNQYPELSESQIEKVLIKKEMLFNTPLRQTPLTVDEKKGLKEYIDNHVIDSYDKIIRNRINGTLSIQV